MNSEILFNLVSSLKWIGETNSAEVAGHRAFAVLLALGLLGDESIATIAKQKGMSSSQLYNLRTEVQFRFPLQLKANTGKRNRPVSFDPTWFEEMSAENIGKTESLMDGCYEDTDDPYFND